MTPPRIAVAAAAVLTAVLLQATLVAPAAITAQLSLPAVLVAATALEEGPGTGMCLGFASGLVADLASAHAAGLLALCWLGLGVGCGLLADARRRLVPRVLLVAVTGAVAGALTTLGLTVLGEPGGTVPAALRGLLPSLLGDFLLAVLVVPMTRRVLHSDLARVAGHG